MAITSAKVKKRKRRYGKTQFRYAFVYILITSVVLVFLNIYCARTSQRIFYQSKESSMVEKCRLAAADFADAEVLTSSNIAEAVADMEGLRVDRLLITDYNGTVLHDSNSESSSLGNYALLPEIVQAMRGSAGQDVFSWEYHDGIMVSRVATPIVSYGHIIGCVYMTEYDTEQGGVIQTLQMNIFSITLALALFVILFSVVFATGYSRRLRRVFASMRIIRGGNYSHRLKMGGRDELTFLGDEFNRLTERLQDSEQRRAQFVSDASHELKTPLASIKLLTDSILQNEMDRDTVQEFVSDIGTEADRLTRMTQKLLSLSHIESQQDGDCEVIYMSPTINRVIRMLSGLLEQNDIQLVMDLRDDCPILILEGDLYQIIFNLVENGIKYNRPGGQLMICTFKEADQIVLQIKDSGVGIPEDSLEHIFERFYRVDKARSRSTGGSGLGLAIVHSMVERNQGSIHADSVPEQGSVFTVSFPIFDVQED